MVHVPESRICSRSYLHHLDLERSRDREFRRTSARSISLAIVSDAVLVPVPVPVRIVPVTKLNIREINSIENLSQNLSANYNL